MQIDPTTFTRRPRRGLACLALLLALLASAALSGAAFARATHGHRPACSSARRAKHAARHCARHHARKGASKTKKPVAKPTSPAPKLTPASCEDESKPVRSAGGSYNCEDGSEPFCPDGSEPFRPSSASSLMCHVPHEEGLECGLEAGGECGAEFSCEDPEEAGARPQGCEYGSAFEEEPEVEV